MRLIRIAEVSSRRSIWLEDDDGGLPRAASGKVVESLVQLAPTLPQSLALPGHRRSPADFVPDSAGQLDDRPRVGLEVQPPGWFGGTPPVHGHRDQVGPVFVVTDNHAPRLAAAPTSSGQAQGTPLTRSGWPQSFAPAARTDDQPMQMPGNHDEPTRW